MKKLFYLLLILTLFSCRKEHDPRITTNLRAPAFPIINIDTYTNAWLFGDTLYQNQLMHWTGKEFPLIGAIQVDGEVYRFMGVEKNLIKSIVNTVYNEDWSGKFVTNLPAGDWKSIDYNDSNWNIGKGAFGVRSAGQKSNTEWSSENIWVRREFILDEDLINSKFILEYSHDDDVEVFVNGVEVVRVNGYCQDNALIELPVEALATLKKGKNVIAAYCKNLGGDAYLDFGLNIEYQEEARFPKTAVQKSVNVLPTQTIYNFTCGPVDLELIFTAPLLMDNLDLLSRPINYISYNIKSNDSKSHAVNLYLEGSQTWALNVFNQKSETEIFEKNNLLFLKAGSKDQPILEKKGDILRIDWGHFYLAAQKRNTCSGLGNPFSMRKEFVENGTISSNNAQSHDELDRFAFSRNIGNVKSQKSGYFMLGYDDIYSIQYFGENLRPYWNSDGKTTILSQFENAEKEYELIMNLCREFDKSLMNSAIKSGGQEYAELCALAYRQSVSAHKLLKAPNGDILFLSKENYSSGSIATVDVTYPSAPLFLLYNIDLLKGMLNPIFHYVESGKWTERFAPHDIGLYPIANGQISGIVLPVEESGNMLILSAAIATMEGNAKYAEKHWKTLSKWADFLVEKGFDPDYQENTDVFTGSSAHNANLSIKAIQGIASYGRLADMLGYNEISQKYTSLARTLALEWVKKTDDGDHFRFAFDQPGPWSQKYNLVWDKILKINVFPHEVPEKEVAFYLTKQNKYGLPLDSRSQYTKADWIVWSATLARSTADFQQFVSPLYRFVNETTDRIPMSDWYWTDRPEHVAFSARSVLGGFYIKMLEDKLISKGN